MRGGFPHLEAAAAAGLNLFESSGAGLGSPPRVSHNEQRFCLLIRLFRRDIVPRPAPVTCFGGTPKKLSRLSK
jgi:hypothetical protein